MTTTTMSTNTVAPTDTRARVSNTVRSFWEAVKYRNHQRRSVRHLRSMSDHTLKDLGIHRSEINSVVYGRDAERVRYHEV